VGSFAAEPELHDPCGPVKGTSGGATPTKPTSPFGHRFGVAQTRGEGWPLVARSLCDAAFTAKIQVSRPVAEAEQKGEGAL
jgi:hypothetical protein